MLQLMLDLAGALLLLGGCALATIGILGMLRRRDIFEQLHAAGLVTGPAVILVLFASLATTRAEVVTSALLVVVVVLVTSSLSTHVIALAAHRRYLQATDPDTSMARRWAGGADPDVAAEPTGQAAPMRVLLAHDGSPSAVVAAELASTLDWPSGTMIRVVGVTMGDLPAFGAGNDDGSGASDPSIGDLATMLEAAAGEIRAAGVQSESLLLEGDPALAIVAEANLSRADLVIVGTRALDTGSLFAPSVAGEIVDRAPCPVLVARTPSVRRILLPTDGSDASDAAIDLVAGSPLFEAAHITLVTVASTGDVESGGDRGDGSDAAATAESAARRLLALGRHAAYEVVVGRPASSITTLAASTNVDLIVLGSRGRTGLTRTVLGSVTREVLTSALCSVLVVQR